MRAALFLQTRFGMTRTSLRMSMPCCRVATAWLALLSATSALSAEPAPTAPIVVGYLPWYRMEGFTADRVGSVTDLIYFGIEPTDTGGFPDEPIPQQTIAQLRVITERTGCRLLLCVGGGGRSN